MKSKRLAALACAAMIMLLAGCSSISAGYITNKAYSPGYWYSTTTCQYVNKTTVCTPHTAYMPPSHRFDITDSGKDGFVYVDEFTFHRYEVGDYYG